MKIWLGVILLCAVLGACGEATRARLRAPEPQPQVSKAQCGDLRVVFVLEKKWRRAPEYRVYLTDEAGQPPSDVTRVLLAFTPAGSGLSTITVVAQPTVEGHYTLPSNFTVTPGSWQVEVIIRRVNLPEATCVLSLNV